MDPDTVYYYGDIEVNKMNIMCIKQTFEEVMSLTLESLSDLKGLTIFDLEVSHDDWSRVFDQTIITG